MTSLKTTLFALMIGSFLCIPAQADPVTGVVVDALGTPVAGATIETFIDGTTVVTGIAGTFTVNVVSGTYSFQIKPPASLTLAPTLVRNVVVNGATNLGTLTLGAGFLLSGSVTDSSGVAVVNGDLDVFDDVTGIKLSTPGGSTSLTGTFSLRVPAGTLRLRAEPAIGQILVSQIQTVTISTNLNVGTVVLPTGYLLTGTVVDSSTSLPLLDVDIDVDDLATGLRIQTPNDNTNILGMFSVIVPAGVHVVSFDPKKGQQILVGKQLIAIVNATPTAMGSIALDPGIPINGTLVDNTGFPVTGADIDVRTQAGNSILYTPGDNTDPNGDFFVVVPAGTHRVIFQPPTASSLVATTTAFQLISAATNLGIVAAQPGFVLSGKVTAFGSVPQKNCTIIVRDSTTGVRVELSDNRTDANGDYAVIVPAGTIDVFFKTRKASLARDTSTSSLLVSGATVLNTSLVLLPMLVYVDDPAFPGPQVVPAGSPQLFITVAIYNPTGVTAGAFLDAEIEGPFGGLTSLLVGSPTILAAGQFIFAQFLAVPLPTFPPSQAGLPHRFRIRLRDPIDNSEIDVDEFTYFPQ